MNRFRLLACLLALLLAGVVACAAEARPNILWLVNEDHGPQVGAYGDRFATTPTFDALAGRGLRYRRCWSNAPVCAPARTTLICGLYASSTGGEHMRSMAAFPAGKQMYPQLLRAAGYYCTNAAKEDYNLTKPGQVWDESSKKAHWKNRPAGAPFMAVFNSERSHESQLRGRTAQGGHDPAKVRVPAYHPDTPEVRQDWARYYDCVSAADADAGTRLRELEEAGLAEETIVFYFSDHGSGMPGNKRWPYNRGLQVPLVVYIPEKFAHLRPPEYKAGGESERLVSFVDFAPTLCSLAGMAPPEWMQGRAFLGKYAAEPAPYLFGFRGRMDERSDCVRSVTDGRFVYLRNFRPDKIYGQYLATMWETPTTRVWERLFQEGKLNAAQAAFWQPKPAEELYDLQSDPDEVHNLAADPAQAERLSRLQAALRQEAIRIRDVGLLPEGEMHRRSAGQAPYDFGHDPALYPVERVIAMAERASSLQEGGLPELLRGLEDKESGVRYWAAVGLLRRGPGAVEKGRDVLLQHLDDPAPEVRLAAAEALGKHGRAEDGERALAVLGAAADWSKNDLFTAMAALNAISALKEKAVPLLPTLKQLPASGPVPDARYKDYVPRLLKELGGEAP